MTPSLEKVRFLIVDDHVHMQQLVKAILKGFGAVHVHEARDSAGALLELRKNPIDIVILDYVLGEEDGLDFIRQVRTAPDSPSPYVSIIMLTAHADRARVELARDAGATEFCTKPVTPAELFRKIGAVIDSPRSFVRAESYFGPNRRRREDQDYAGPERRGDRRPKDSS